MKRYAVIGASSGTGLALVKQLTAQRSVVRAISRRPPNDGPYIEPFAADVTDPASIAKALDAPFDAVFYTVDIHELFQPREAIRSTMVDGCVNALAGVKAATAAHPLAPPARFVLLSVIGPDRPSWVWWLLNASKRGMQRNVLDREHAVKSSSQPYVICRAPRLHDRLSAGAPLWATPPQHSLDMGTDIARVDLARALILAARYAPANSSWDVFAGGESRVQPPRWLQTTPGD